jgi:YD repeat-containing protein
MPNGEDTVDWQAKDLAGSGGAEELGLEGVTTHTLKVDAEPPHNLEVSGWSKTPEISAAPHTLTVEATAGAPSTPRPGVKSIAVSVDGGPESTVPNASCPEGPCTGSGKYTLDAESLTEGVHRLVVTATDNAGNIAAREFTFDVRHGSPVPVGPGTVDPTTGQFKLSATDVSLAGSGGVSRVYQSRNPAAGAGGPLGPQWAIGLGGGQGLTVLPTGSVVLSSSAGATTTFTPNEKEKGQFESPRGDGNVKVEAKEKEAGKGITEYLLKETVAGATTTFKQPAGTELTTPVYSNQFGAEGAQLSNPVSDAVDSHGNVWVASLANDRIEKFSPAGALLGSYGSYGTGVAELIRPWGIAVNQSNGDVYVTDEGNSRVTELSEKGEFIRTFGWGVNGKNELQECKEYCQAGIAGSGAGQFKEPKGLAVDSSGNVWVADFGNNRVEEFNSEGKYLKTIVSKGEVEGSGEGQFKRPVDLAFSGGNLYVTDNGNERVDEFSSAGTYLKKFGESGTGNGQFNEPKGIATDPRTGNLYVADGANKRVQEFTPEGKFIDKFGVSGTGAGQFVVPTGVAVNSTGGIYASDNGGNRVEEWTRPTWLPAISEDSFKNVTSAYEYKAEEEEGATVIEPTEALASAPAGVTCGKPGELKPEELKKGCRALLFTYATKTKSAIGEGPSEWGEYKGHLQTVSFKVYNPAKGAEKMEEKAVAEYAYDSKGRLRAEWDPRISPALKTTYGYDTEGHVTAVTSPGQQPWLLTYGTIAGDSNAGRLISVTRPSSSTAFGGGSLPVNTVAPTISGSLAVGTNASVSTGTWSNSPLSYAYQWELCNSSGTGCSPILGATNATYFIGSGSVGHKLVVHVSATNMDGSQAVASNASAVVPKPAWFFYPFGEGGSGAGQLSDPTGEAVDSKGNLWVVDSGNDRVEEFTGSGTYVTSYGKEGTGEIQFKKPTGIAINPTTGNLYITDSGNDRVEEITPEGKYVTSFGTKGEGNGEFNDPTGIAFFGVVQIYVVDTGNDRVEIFSASNNKYERGFGSKGTGKEQFTSPEGISVFTGEAGTCVYVTDTGNDRVQGLWANLYGEDFESSFGSKGSGNGEFLSPVGIETEEYSGRIQVVDSGNDRVESFKGPQRCETLEEFKNVTYQSSFGTLGSGGYGQLKNPQWIAEDTKGSYEGALYVSDSENKRIVQAWGNALPELPAEPPAPPNPGSSAVWTVEYRVPLSEGSGLTAMTAAKVKEWGQQDHPYEAMAIFPPDKPMGWPAKEYERATINYMDEHGRTVNVASPSGGISTTEYNEINQVTRTLSPDNRATVMRVSPESARIKTAESLETKSTYNAKGQLAETLGPEHEVKIVKGNEKVKSGSEVAARDHVVYSYDEGSPEGKTYNLVTKTVNAAETASKEEFDPRTTVSSYSGQENLGWVLRKPTSTTIEPEGLNLTTTTVYQENSKKESTGAVVETRSPEGSSGQSRPALVYSLQFGTKGTGNGQFTGPAGDAVDAGGNVWVNDFGGDRIEKFSSSGVFIASYGSEGTGGGQFSEPAGVAVNQSSGNVYVVDKGHNRVEELSTGGAFVRTFGFGVSNGKAEFEICTSSCEAGIAGSGSGQFNAPHGVAVDSSGNVWVADSENNRLEEFSSTGTFIAAYGSWGTGEGNFKYPTGIAFGNGKLYVSDDGNYRVQEISTSGAYAGQFGSQGTGNGQFESVNGIAVDPVSGGVYVVDAKDDRVEEFMSSGGFVAAYGAKGTGNGQFVEPEGVAVNAAGDVYVADSENDRVEMWEPVPSAPVFASSFGSKGAGADQVDFPDGSAVDSHGNVWVADDVNNRVDEFSSSGSFTEAVGFGVSNGKSELQTCTSTCQAGVAGTGNGQFSGPNGVAFSGGNMYVLDSGNDRVQELNEKLEYVTKFGAKGTAAGDFESPEGIAIDSAGDVWVGDLLNHRVEKFTSSGTFSDAIGFGVSDGKSEFEICTSSCRAGLAGSETKQFKSPAGVAYYGGHIYVADSGNGRVEELNEKGEYVAMFGTKGTGSGELDEPVGIAINPTNGNVSVTSSGNGRVETFTSGGSFLYQFGSEGSGNGQLKGPAGISINSSGDLYLSDTANQRLQEWTPAPRPGNEGAHDVRTAYYSAEEESEVAACRKHPEWAGLPCQVEAAAQTGVSGSPELPVTTFTSYNMWDEVETTTEKFGTGSGAVTRIKAQTYDPAGRALTSEEKAEPVTDTALPKVTNEYNAETGALEKQSATIKKGTKEETKTTTSVLNTLGQLEKYTDAEGNTSTYVYNLEGQVEEVNDGQSEKDGVQTYAYSAKTGYLEKLVDSSAKTFTATYDVEGKMLTENYPNAMTAKYTYNQVGAATGIEYKKEKDCAGTCPEIWFSDADVPSIHGETLEQKSTLSKENYAYDDGQLIETQEIPTGKGCKSRLYGYDEEGNRTSETTRESSTETCATEGGLLQAHIYDSANHLIDAGVTYETFGNTTKMPEADAEGHELTGAYYVDNQVASQTQNGTTNEYVYDPAGRTIETKSEVKSTKVKTTTIPHYSGSGEALTWASEEEEKGTEKVKRWTRNIPGIDGALDAIEKSGEETKPVLQIHDLQGNIVGEVADSETETKLGKTYDSTEFGVPNEGKAPPKYAWLGAGGVASETSFGTGTVTQGGASYVPQVARNLQTAPVVPPGAFPNGQGTGSENTSEIPGWSTALAEQESANTLAVYTAKQEQEKKEKEEALQATAKRIYEEVFAYEAGEEDSNELEVVNQYAQPITGGAGSEPVATESVPCRQEDDPEGVACNDKGEPLIRAFGHELTPNQILRRTKAEYAKEPAYMDNKDIAEVKEGLKAILGGLKQTPVTLEAIINGARVVATEFFEVVDEFASDIGPV